MGLLSLLSANELVAQTISFLILLVILKRYMWKPFLKTLDERRDRIAHELNTIDTVKKEVEAIKADYQRRIDDIDAIAQARIAELVKQGNVRAEEIRQKAEEDAQRTTEKAQERIAAEIAQAKEDLKNSVVDLAIAVTEKMIQEKLTDTADRRVVEEFLRGIEKKS